MLHYQRIEIVLIYFLHNFFYFSLNNTRELEHDFVIAAGAGDGDGEWSKQISTLE